MKPCVLMFFLVTCLGLLLAQAGEYSASANALCGITVLSESVADHAISPVIYATGVTISRHQPFGLNDATYYGLHNAVPLGLLHVATGINYLSHPDYRWQDQYLSLRVGSSTWAVGATQHLSYERIAEASWYTWDNDLAISYLLGGYGTEIRWLRCHSQNPALVLSGQSIIGPGASVCSAYTWRKNEADSYSVASSYRLSSALLLQTSWQSEPSRFGIGCKFSIGLCDVMYSLRTHPELDLTHSLDIGSSW